MLRCKNCKHPASESSWECKSCGQSFESGSGCLAAIGTWVGLVTLLMFILRHPWGWWNNELEVEGKKLIVLIVPTLAASVAYCVVAVKAKDRGLEDV
jgi:hypothetical protein